VGLVEGVTIVGEEADMRVPPESSLKDYCAEETSVGGDKDKSLRSREFREVIVT